MSESNSDPHNAGCNHFLLFICYRKDVLSLLQIAESCTTLDHASDDADKRPHEDVQ